MHNQRSSWVQTMGAVAAAAALTLGSALAQQQDAPAPAQAPGPGAAPDAKGKTAVRPRPRTGLRAPGGAVPKSLRKNAGDPLAAPPVADNQGPIRDDEIGKIHYSFKLAGASSNSTPLHACYYPSRLGTGAAVVMMIHEKGRSDRDFQEPIADLKKVSLAEHLQDDGFAVLLLDLPGHGANPRRELSQRNWREAVEDLQAAYRFLLDRHNRGELNLARLGVVGVGEGANLAALWASLPGGAVSGEGRTSDLGALVLVSPMVDGQSQGLRAGPTLASLAQRVPILILSGERDAASKELVTGLRPVIERSRVNKIELFPTSLHGYKLLWLEPNAANAVGRFFETTTKFKAEEWEPRYNLNPVPYTDPQSIRRNTLNRPVEAPATKKAQ